jgi:two-component system, chemotaxis family, protein-glutamate methylesterase/glutaminase
VESPAADPGSARSPGAELREAKAPTATRDTVVIGASAGGVETLGTVIRGLREDLPAAVLVVLHLMSSGRSMLPQILSRSGELPAAPAEDGEPLLPGRVYVAPPDHHMLVRDSEVRVIRGPRENGHRPAIDPLFRSAARARGPRVVGVVLSGLLDDGASGLAAVKERGGMAIVQHPDDALFPAMPRAAMAAVSVDCAIPAGEIPQVLTRWVGQRVEETPQGEDEPDRVERDPTGLKLVDGEPTPVSCPACGGPMWETMEDGVLRFVCQVGHAYSPEAMISEQGSAVESAMWAALRILEERGQLLQRMAGRQHGGARKRFERKAQDAEDHARRIRAVLLDHREIETTAES